MKIWAYVKYWKNNMLFCLFKGKTCISVMTTLFMTSFWGNPFKNDVITTGMKSAGNLSVFKTYLTCFTLRHILRANFVVRDSTSLNKNKLSEFNYRYKPKSMTAIVRRTNTFILKSDVSLKY